MDISRAAEINLNFLLAPIAEMLADPALTDLHINGVGEGMCFVDRGAGIQRITLPYTWAEYEEIAICAAALTRQDIAEDVPLVMTKFPGGHRVQIIRPPAISQGAISFSIRRPSAETWTPHQLESQGVFKKAVAVKRGRPANFDQMLAHYRNAEWRPFIELAIKARLNVVFSGSVGTGKTTNMRSFTHAIPEEWRVVTIEDMEELIALPCANVVNLLYSKGGQSIANVSATGLVEAALRMGMDGLLVQELRDEAAYAYLNVLKSGHWGMTSVHAETAEDAFERIAGLVKQHPAGMQLAEADVLKTLRRCVHVIVHSVRGEGRDRHVEQVYWEPGHDLEEEAA